MDASKLPGLAVILCYPGTGVPDGTIPDDETSSQEHKVVRLRLAAFAMR